MVELDYKKYLEQIETPPKLELKWVWTVAGPGAIIASLTIGSGELVWTPRAAAAFGYVMVWAFLYGVWIKGIVQYLANRWHTLTGISTSIATAKVLTKWFNLFLTAVILAVMPMWFVTLSSLSAQVPWAALGRPAPLLYFWIVVVVATELLLIFAARLGKAYKVIEKISLTILWGMFVAFWVATLIGTRPDWGAFFANLFIPRPIPPYEDWIRTAAPDIWALTPLMLLGSALGALGGGIQDYIGYQAMLREKGWGLLKFSDEMLKKVHEIGLGKLPLPEDEESRRKLNGWLLATKFDCGLSFLMVFIVTIPAVILTIEVLRPRHMAPSGLRLVEVQAAWLTETLGPWAGIIWWLGSFFALWGTFYGLHEVYMWTIYDLVRTTFKKFADISPNKVRLYLWPYLIVVGAIFFLTGFSLPILVAFASAATHLFALALWGIALLYLNMKYLPKAYRPHIVIVILAIIGICIYLPYGLIQLIQVFVPTFTI
ncbi:MAG: Nramp family divalent metal transporter [Sulfolobales archaeon]